jgi:two-component system, NtrC family, sensor kinase
MMAPSSSFSVRRTWSYRVKVPLLIISISLATAFAISIAIAVSARHWLTEDLHDHARAVAQSLARGLVVHMARDDVWEAFEAVRAVANVEGGAQRCDVVVLDQTGRIFVASDPTRFGVRQGVEKLSKPLASAYWQNAPPGTASVMTVPADGQTYSVIKMPLVSTDQELIGTLLMSYSHAIFAERYRETLRTLGAITASLIVVLLPLGWWLGHRLASPMTRVTDALYRLAETAAHQSPGVSAQELSHESAKTEAADEIDRLEHSLVRLQAQLAEKEELQQQFVAADRLAAIGRMTSSVAHEINNPLAGMRNALSNLKREPRLVFKTVGLLERGLAQIQETVSALLIETKTQARPLTVADIEDLRLLLKAQTDHRYRTLHWTYRIDTDLPLPAAPVRQIVLNLLLNAVAASESRVEFDAHLEGSCLVFGVANDGSEIPPARRKQLFAPLASTEGHGLGLWASHQLVTSLGGTVTVSSDATRTHFEVRLPLNTSAAVIAVTADAQAA